MTPRFTFFGIVVQDMAASLAFYRRLGFDIPASADAEPHVEVALPGGLLLVFDTVDVVRSFDPHWEPPKGSPRTALAFTCDSPADVDATYAALVAAGHEGHHAPWDAVWGQRYASVYDPDGNSVDLLAALPTT
ncbi:VOC family protein [Yinghuangia seranimata]|uniref:VOC family protein n=1 Tax=Yinghuangia seranimata TaxID=408067 RepID=UPI00248D313E|nr:VOC family protein [Yinghuangia seranimata]MDI2128612.1 VOC family protein [Yinghuangia seranimata]